MASYMNPRINEQTH